MDVSSKCARMKSYIALQGNLARRACVTLIQRTGNGKGSQPLETRLLTGSHEYACVLRLNRDQTKTNEVWSSNIASATTAVS